MSEHMPPEHVPSSMRPPVQTRREGIAYGCAWAVKPLVGHSIGLEVDAARGYWAGPFPTLAEALECVPPEAKSLHERIAGTPAVIRMEEDGTDRVLYTWSVAHGKAPRWLMVIL